MNREDRIVYEAYLKTNEWKNKRIQKAEQQNYKCEICGKIVLSGYHIHHKTYKNLMNEPLSDLQFLCEDCHKEVHRKKRERTVYGINSKLQNKKKSGSSNKNKGCNYCKYSCCQHYTCVDRYVLWCNKLYEECTGKRCEHFRNGSYKEAKQKYWKKKLK